MAKKSKIAKNNKRAVIIARFAERRAELKAIIKSPKTTPDEMEAAFIALRKLPRDSSATRYRNRCVLTGRPHGYLRKFGLSRIAFRELALAGMLPGVTKSSW